MSLLGNLYLFSKLDFQPAAAVENFEDAAQWRLTNFGANG